MQEDQAFLLVMMIPDPPALKPALSGSDLREVLGKVSGTEDIGVDDAVDEVCGVGGAEEADNNDAMRRGGNGRGWGRVRRRLGGGGGGGRRRRGAEEEANRGGRRVRCFHDGRVHWPRSDILGTLNRVRSSEPEPKTGRVFTHCPL